MSITIPGRHYTVPWQWGTTGIIVNTDFYKGDINTSAIFFDPPDELKGKINVVPEMSDVMHAAIRYVGGELLHRRQGGAEEGPRHADRRQAELDFDGLLAPSRRYAKRGLRRRRSTGTAAAFRASACRTTGLRLRLSQGRLSVSGWTMSPCSRMPRTSRTPSYSRISSWTGECRDDLGLRPLCQRHQGFGRISCRPT